MSKGNIRKMREEEKTFGFSYPHTPNEVRKKRR